MSFLWRSQKRIKNIKFYQNTCFSGPLGALNLPVELQARLNVPNSIREQDILAVNILKVPDILSVLDLGRIQKLTRSWCPNYESVGSNYSPLSPPFRCSTFIVPPLSLPSSLVVWSWTNRPPVPSKVWKLRRTNFGGLLVPGDRFGHSQGTRIKASAGRRLPKLLSGNFGGRYPKFFFKTNQCL